jgi:hypothetical protein
MIKQTWKIEDSEKLRILNLHESATKKQYLFFEQRIETKTIEPKKFALPNNTFASGKYKEFDKAAVDGVITQLMDYIKDYPQNQQIKLEVESSESRVPNRGVGLKPGDLSRLRADEMVNYIKGKLPQNVSVEIKNLGVQGPGWSPPKDATTDQIRNLANDPQYTRWQYVTFNVAGSGEKQEEICELGFKIIVDYQEEWCKPKVDERKCHKCNKAVFNMWANGIPLTTDSGDPNINLNNAIGPGVSGPSRVVTLNVTKEQKEQILLKNPEEILITYNCALDNCHSDPAHVTIISDNGQVLLPGTHITTGGVSMSKNNPPVKLLKLNKCGEKLAVAGDKGMTPEPKPQPKPKVKAFKLSTDENGDYTAESLYEIFKFVKNGILEIPKDQIELFRDFKSYNNNPWNEFVDSFISRRAKRNFEKYIRTKTNQ